MSPLSACTIHNLETSSRAESVSNAPRGVSNYLLTGILLSPDGRKWEGQQEKACRLKKNNQLKGRQLQSACVDKAVIDQLLTGLKTDKFVDQLFDDLNKSVTVTNPSKKLKSQLPKIEKDISKAMEFALTIRESRSCYT